MTIITILEYIGIFALAVPTGHKHSSKFDPRLYNTLLTTLNGKLFKKEVLQINRIHKFIQYITPIKLSLL